MADPESQMDFISQEPPKDDFHLQRTSNKSGFVLAFDQKKCTYCWLQPRVSCMCYTALKTLQNTACASMQICAVPRSRNTSYTPVSKVQQRMTVNRHAASYDADYVRSKS